MQQKKNSSKYTLSDRSCGLDELYAVLRGESFTDIADQFGGIVSVTYSPAMIQTAIRIWLIIWMEKM